MLEQKSETLRIDSIGGGCFSNTGGLAGEEKEMNSLMELWDKIYSKYGRWVRTDKTTHEKLKPEMYLSAFISEHGSKLEVKAKKTKTTDTVSRLKPG